MTNFFRTLEVVLANTSVQSEREENTVNLKLGPARSSEYRFRLLAASTAEEIQLPDLPWVDTSQMISTTQIVHGEDLHLEFQAQGYAALIKLSGKKATLVSANGLLEQQFGFDAQGSAVIVLANMSIVREALADFKILL